jgi:hypothetical protein
MSKVWPSQDVLETEKTPKWYAQHLDFAEELLKNGDARTSKMSRLYNGYNGVVASKSVAYLTHAYGFKNKNKYIDYRVGRTKIDILHGEFLKIPLNSTVRTINSDAVVKKLEQYDFNLGAASVRDEIQKLRSVGVDPLEGMEPEDPADPNFQKKIKPKDRYEIIMQRIINSLVEKLDIVEKIGSNFLDGEITSRMYSQIVVDERTGAIDLDPIDPRDGIWFEFDKDPFLKKTFLMGRRQKMSINEVLTKLPINDTQRQTLKGIRDNFTEYVNNPDYKGKYSIQNGEYIVEVIHIEWMGLRREYTKKSPKTKSQMEFSNKEDGFLNISVTAGVYEANKKEVDKNAKKNGQEVITEFTKELYEGCRIGHLIDVNCRVKPFTMKDEDTGDPMFSYTGCLIKPVDGESISLQEVIENFSSLFNVVMYQINREIGKMKGKSLVIDKGLLPKGKTVKQLLYQITNDSFTDLSSAGLTNMAGKDMNIMNMIKEFDLGLSDSFPQLVALKNDILQLLDFMTGINNERTGDIQASSTSGNAMAAVEASRTITEGLFFYTHKYTENVLIKLAETAKVVWGIYNPDKLRTILGDSDFEYIEATADLADQKYGVYLTNGRRESELMQKIEKYAEFYANSKELQFVDLVDVTLAESLSEIKTIAVNGWERVQAVREAETNKQLMAQRDNVQSTNQANLEAVERNRKLQVEGDLLKIAAKGQADLAVKTAEQKGDMILNQQDAINAKNNNQQGSV